MEKIKIYEFECLSNKLVVLDHGQSILTILCNGTDLGTGYDFEILDPESLLEYRTLQSLDSFTVIDGFSARNQKTHRREHKQR